MSYSEKCVLLTGGLEVSFSIVSTIIPLLPESSSPLMWVYISVYVGPRRNPKDSFSCRSSYGAVVVSSLIAKYDYLQLMLLYVT